MSKPCKKFGHTGGRDQWDSCIECKAMRVRIKPTKKHLRELRALARDKKQVEREELKLRKKAARVEKLRLRTEEKALHAKNRLVDLTLGTARAQQGLAVKERGELPGKVRRPFVHVSQQADDWLNPQPSTDPMHSPPPEPGHFTSIQEKSKPPPPKVEKPVRQLSKQAEAHLRNYAGASAGGFWDPGGTVSQNIIRERGPGTVKVCRGLVPWGRNIR